MSYRVTTAAVLCLVCLGLTACGGDDILCEVLYCALATGMQVAPAGGINVYYDVDVTGNGFLSALSYWDDAGEHVVANPPGNWEVDVNVSAGNPYGMVAAGGVTYGSLLIEYVAHDGVRTSGEDFCAEYCW
jgi:hypothetical protein